MPRAAATRLFLNNVAVNDMCDNVHLRARFTHIPKNILNLHLHRHQQTRSTSMTISTDVISYS